MPDRVISNTSPLFYLHRLRRLELLRELYQRIIVPDAVVDELKAGREQGEDVPEVAAYEWIDVRSVRVPEVVALITDLELGRLRLWPSALKNQAVWWFSTIVWPVKWPGCETSASPAQRGCFSKRSRRGISQRLHRYSIDCSNWTFGSARQ